LDQLGVEPPKTKAQMNQLSERIPFSLVNSIIFTEDEKERAELLENLSILGNFLLKFGI
jgi:hypothetical protein